MIVDTVVLFIVVESAFGRSLFFIDQRQTHRVSLGRDKSAQPVCHPLYETAQPFHHKQSSLSSRRCDHTRFDRRLRHHPNQEQLAPCAPLDATNQS